MLSNFIQGWEFTRSAHTAGLGWSPTGVEECRVINGMVYKIRTGISWRDLPERYGPWKTVCTRFRRYALDGIFTGRTCGRCRPRLIRRETSTGWSRSTPSSSAPISTPPPAEKGGPPTGRMITPSVDPEAD
ncbi:transposase [Streptomyces sviceus]|uniref:transposase n=1 Tax=Streptomyces sviceus TaxID=285530 RepID=UPI0036E995E0